MNRRIILTGIGAMLAAAVRPAVAQRPARIPTVGLLTTTLEPDDPLLIVLRANLRQLGYVDGQNIHFEYRGAHGDVDRLPPLAQELVQLRVDVIVALPDPAVLAAKRATSTVPIVMNALAIDPVAAGVVQSFGRPGGNVTGVYNRQSELGAKRLQLLQEMIPSLSRVGVLYDSFGAADIAELDVAARSLNLELVRLEVKVPYDLEHMFSAAREARVGAIIALYSVPLYVKREEIARLALKARLPSMAYFDEFARAGGLISYGTDTHAAFARIAYFIDKLLKGAKPSDLPVEQAVAVKLLVNLKTAKSLGITISPAMLFRADDVIR